MHASNALQEKCHNEIVTAVPTIVGLFTHERWWAREAALNVIAAIAVVCESFYYCSHMYLILLKRNALLRLERLWNRWWSSSRMVMLMCNRLH